MLKVTAGGVSIHAMVFPARMSRELPQDCRVVDGSFASDSTTYIYDVASRRDYILSKPAGGKARWEAQLFASGSKYSRVVARVRRRARST